MKWENRRSSSNIEDRRGSGGRLGGLGGIRLSGGAMVLLAVAYLLFGGKLSSLPYILSGVQSQSQSTNIISDEDFSDSEDIKKFTGVVLADTEDVWNEKFKEIGKTYEEPSLVIYSGGIKSGCGVSSSAVGPFYCSADEKIYIDLSFYNTMKRDLGSKGDFAFAYVIAHEIGHHVQNQLGILNDAHRQMASSSKKVANEISVRLELQADYFAGVFARYVQDKGYLEKGDIEEAMEAARSVGDDTLQMKNTGTINPDSFTHGTSEDRMKWFNKGFEYGTIEDGNTF
ncbi:neutral zinc metallopeptidase [Citroniella saccharovorans]|uniref:Neutral zinc metallopeptidase n=1 Tax=Citroniella saccharovorans TaxID=2053367 RepID=A0AAW9MS46_9FIRM|nr:neutral zinc metallopeptidase [Citroniella saccharovorans]MEB3429964.1 neutral zinc metallopeptidase [Citroniella saccharovorans]